MRVPIPAPPSAHRSFKTLVLPICTQVTEEAKKRLAELEAAIAAEEAVIELAQAEAAGFTAEAERLAAALADVGGPKLRKQRALVDRLQQVSRSDGECGGCRDSRSLAVGSRLFAGITCHWSMHRLGG